MPSSYRPLAVDLDGTLIHTDLLYESILVALKKSPYLLFIIPFWLIQGKAALKQKLASTASLSIDSLPFNQNLIDWLKLQKNSGRKLILCTASDISLAQKIADHLDIFDEVIASHHNINLSGKNKAKILIERFGENQFDYAGNSSVDLVVWSAANKAVVVSNSTKLQRQAGNCTNIEIVFTHSKKYWDSIARALRVHQWIKNLLIFVPLLAAHKAQNTDSWLSLMLAFLAFSICASAVYIVNDLLDLESDRQHLRKRYRPFASGEIPIIAGIFMAPILLILSFVLALYIGPDFFYWLVIYCGLTCAYSWRLKQVVLVDCVTLAILYTLRIVAGASVAEVPLSFWLLAFSIFLFLSLAFIKRYAELDVQELGERKKVHGRGYFTTDAPLIEQLGVTSGYTAVLILALYLNSESVILLYRTPQIIWAAIPLMLLWLSWMWLKAHRGQMHDDPIVFAIKDRLSLLVGSLFVITFLLANW